MEKHRCQQALALRAKQHGGSRWDTRPGQQKCWPRHQRLAALQAEVNVQAAPNLVQQQASARGGGSQTRQNARLDVDLDQAVQAAPLRLAPQPGFFGDCQAMLEYPMTLPDPAARCCDGRQW